MAYDLEEQEQLAALKAWWARWGNKVSTVVLLVALVFAGWNGWNWWQRNQAGQAAGAYEDLQAAVAAKDLARAKGAAGTLFDQYARTPYAQMGGLLSARLLYDNGDLRTAKAQLQWVVEHARDEPFKLVARLRLAGILLDEGALDDALKQVTGSVPPAFEMAYADRRGDILLAQKKIDEARAAWKEALDKADENGTGYRQIVQLKLDDLGPVASAGAAVAAPVAGAAPAAAAPAAAAAAPAASAAPAAPAAPAAAAKSGDRK